LLPLAAWWHRSFSDASIFWVMTTAIATVVLAWVAFAQLGGLAETSRADFVFRLKSEFFNDKSRRLIFLIEEDLLTFVGEGESGYFVIKNFSSDETRTQIRHLGFEQEKIPSQEVDDLILGILEDVGMFQRKGVIEIEDVYVIFDTYVMDCIENPAIQRYLEFSRKGRGNKDVWAEFRLLARRLKAIEPKIRAKYKEMLRES
jgi:hypothetical protein